MERRRVFLFFFVPVWGFQIIVGGEGIDVGVVFTGVDISWFIVPIVAIVDAGVVDGGGVVSVIEAIVVVIVVVVVVAGVGSIPTKEVSEMRTPFVFFITIIAGGGVVVVVGGGHSVVVVWNNIVGGKEGKEVNGIETCDTISDRKSFW